MQNPAHEASRPAKRAKIDDAEAGASTIPELECIRQSDTQLAYLQAQLAATEALYSAYDEELQGLASQLKGVKHAHLRAGKPLWKEGAEQQAGATSAAGSGLGAGESAAPEAGTFSDIEEDVLLYTEEEDAAAAAAGGEAALAGAEEPGAASGERLAALEATCSAISQEDMEAQGAVGCLAGRSGRYYLRSTAVTLGRATDTKGDVDVDLAPEEAAAAAAGAGSSRDGAGAGQAAGQAGAPGTAARTSGQSCAAAQHSVSRRQALLRLGPDGQFRLTNMGRQAVVVNDVPLPQGHTVCLPHLSLVEIGGGSSTGGGSSSSGVRLLFLANLAAVGRVVRRSSALVL
ncbi:hypothetical protein HXX76_003431 [Chlamydomonas incerta]|uniref:FHA domain-containing protein n=1 Tax=Chlamydomonas incerta TaxID=51695 RepID=A0A835W8P5_CHLIN|nr:hypothetical protein HXX76_003431 [Chlamydomonas incerta]|eukprot:KAG2441823.1 hypothetical protein HXX76_003431 [Chlamydomonas incerta]